MRGAHRIEARTRWHLDYDATADSWHVGATEVGSRFSSIPWHPRALTSRQSPRGTPRHLCLLQHLESRQAGRRGRPHLNSLTNPDDAAGLQCDEVLPEEHGMLPAAEAGSLRPPQLHPEHPNCSARERTSQQHDLARSLGGCFRQSKFPVDSQRQTRVAFSGLAHDAVSSESEAQGIRTSRISCLTTWIGMHSAFGGVRLPPPEGNAP